MAVFDLDRDGGSLMVFPLCAELLIRVQGYPGVKYWLWCLVQYSGGRGGEGGNTVSICQTVMLLARCSGAGLGHVKHPCIPPQEHQGGCHLEQEWYIWRGEGDGLGRRGEE